MNRLNAVSKTFETLVPYNTDKFPVEKGNCFGVETDDGKDFRIVNFGAENWDEVLRLGVELPIKILPIGEKHALIHDERVPDTWYWDTYCETCCPRKFWPHSQLMRRERKELRGDISVEGEFEIYRVGMRHETFPLFYKKENPITHWKFNLNTKMVNLSGKDV